MSLSNHGAWQYVTLAVVLYADQRGRTLGRAASNLLELEGGVK